MGPGGGGRAGRVRRGPAGHSWWGVKMVLAEGAFRGAGLPAEINLGMTPWLGSVCKHNLPPTHNTPPPFSNKMPPSRPPQSLADSIPALLRTLQTTLQSDTLTTLSDLDLLQRVNTHAAAQYKAMADAAQGGLGGDLGYLQQKYGDIARYAAQVDGITAKVDELERVVRELDEWTGELEVKVRRLTSLHARR
ncbi:biogenesis of lysosome-related organelles complex-1 subunit 2-domain-containing protein [Tirmania nivea]|nr:biogenesis of lysosome-related organelles complex-1 subunit 2-domain-containing protein [Tirmania nivea]